MKQITMDRENHTIWLYTALCISMLLLLTGAATATNHETNTSSISFELTGKIATATTGENVSIPLSLTNTESASLTIGSNALNWKTSLEITDVNNDDSVTVKINTQNVGRSGTVFTASGPDTVSNINRIQIPNFNNTSRELAADSYPLSARVDGEEKDVAVLLLTEPDGLTPVCGVDPSPLVDIYNENLERVPGLLSGLIDETTIHGEIEGERGGSYTIKTGNDRRITDISPGRPDSAGVIITTDCDAFIDVVGSENPGRVFNEKYDDGEIEINGDGFTNALQVEAFKIGYSIGQSLGFF